MKDRLERLKTIRSDLQDANLYIVDDDGMWPWPEGDEIVSELLDAEIKRIIDNDAEIKEAFRKLHESMEQSIELMRKVYYQREKEARNDQS